MEKTPATVEGESDAGFLDWEDLKGHGDIVSRLIPPINHEITPIIPIINLLSPHDPPRSGAAEIGMLLAC